MGYYIQTRSNKGKADIIIAEMGGVEIPQPKSFEEIPADKALIVVLDNGLFEAAGLAYDPTEFRAFTMLDDYRPKRFVLLNRDVAYKAAGYNPRE
jgi:hypothetical protein